MLLQLLEGPHCHQELVRLLHYTVAALRLLDFVLELVDGRLGLLSKAELLVLGTASEVEVEQMQLPREEEVQKGLQAKA